MAFRIEWKNPPGRICAACRPVRWIGSSKRWKLWRKIHFRKVSKNWPARNTPTVFGSVITGSFMKLSPGPSWLKFNVCDIAKTFIESKNN